ncbi:MAG: cysteine desulfurase-like protein [Alphaproteobacteria bacterium]
MDDFPIAAIRDQFPALALTDGGRARVYADNPAGTQVPQRVVDRVAETLVHANANLGGAFATSRAAGALLDTAHQAMADMLHAASAGEIVFGANMTTLTLHIARCLADRFAPGDEIVLSRMDHDANVAPWLLMAEDRGLAVRWVDFDPETFEFADDALDRALTERTRLVAVGYASNCLGTINDVARIAAKARAAGALCFVDAVQLAPHRPVDVQAIGCDLLVCSAYKFFGTHVGVLWGRSDLLSTVKAYKVRPAGDGLPDRFETGTLNHEGIAGVLGAVEYFKAIGAGMVPAEIRAAHAGKRHGTALVHAALDWLARYEDGLTARLIDGLARLPGVRVQGITGANALHRRVPTVSITVDGHAPAGLAAGLADAGIFTWAGHNYAVEPIRRLGLHDAGGVLRIGLAHYNTAGEVDRIVTELGRLIGSRP